MKIISMKGLVEKASGKVCQHDNNSVTYRKKDGMMFSQRRCNPRDLQYKPYTEKEKKIKSDFGTKSKIAAAWTKANRVYRPNSRIIDLAASSEAYRKMRVAFDAQNKIPTFQAFVWSCIKDGVVVVPDVSLAGSGTGGPVTPGSGSIADQTGNNPGTGTPTDNNGETAPGFGDY